MCYENMKFYILLFEIFLICINSSNNHTALRGMPYCSPLKMDTGYHVIQLRPCAYCMAEHCAIIRKMSFYPVYLL